MIAPIALEDRHHGSRCLKGDLLMAAARYIACERGKSHPIDALAIAWIALREPNSPVAVPDRPDGYVQPSVDHSENLVTDRTQAENRLRWHLRERMPGDESAPCPLHRAVDLLARGPSPGAGHHGRPDRPRTDRHSVPCARARPSR